MRRVKFHDLGLKDYKETWDFQTDLFEEIIAKKVAQREANVESKAEAALNHLIFCEHPHVYTLGKSGKPEHLLLSPEELKARNIAYYPINRGGDITYHGPGQIVGYPILDLDQFFTDIHRYLRTLEEAVILTLQEYGISAGRLEGYTGVWLDENDPKKARKICAMGVKCSRWVTMHGFAFNVNTNLDYFKNIIPCGIDDKDVSSMQRELGKEVDILEVKGILRRHLESLLEFQIQA
ncbi:MAG: lipoyl(octanoyl) transferase LipB [Luteibaculum sp.]